MILVCVLKLLGIFLSFYGYYRFLRVKFDIKQEFCPVIVMSTTGLVIFLSGILNLMMLCAYIVYSLGLVCLVWSIYTLRTMKLSQIIIESFRDLTPGLVLFALLSAYLFFWLSHQKYYYYDNFSFWGLAVKLLSYENEFPKFDNAILEFTSYPPGSASLIWYICRFIGYTEGHTLAIQSVYILSCALPFFVFVEKKSKTGYLISLILALLGALFLVTCGAEYGNGIYNLLVDVMLAAVGIAAYAIAIYYRKDLKAAVVLTVPLLSFEVCIKNSGLFWVFVISLLLVYLGFREGKSRMSSVLLFVQGMLCPLMVRLLWDAHVRYVFSNVASGNHAVALDYYRRRFAEKTGDDIRQISRLFLNAVFSKDNRFWLLLLLLLLLAVVVRRTDKALARKHDIPHIAFFIMLVYVLYQCGNYCVYLFSMPIDDAEHLASFDRYSTTVNVFVAGVFIIKLIQITGELDGLCKESYRCIPVFVICSLFLLLLCRENTNFSDLFRHRQASAKEESRNRLEKIKNEYELSEGSADYILYISERDGEYRKFMSRFLLYSPNIQTITGEQLDMLSPDFLSGYDTLIILEKDEEIQSWLENNSLPDEECIDLNSAF